MAVIELTTQNFNEEVLQSDVPVMVDFWASWCGPCRMVSPIVDEIAEEVQGKAKVGKVNVDEQGDLASQFGVMSIEKPARSNFAGFFVCYKISGVIECLLPKNL